MEVWRKQVSDIHYLGWNWSRSPLLVYERFGLVYERVGGIAWGFSGRVGFGLFLFVLLVGCFFFVHLYLFCFAFIPQHSLTCGGFFCWFCFSSKLCFMLRFRLKLILGACDRWLHVIPDLQRCFRVECTHQPLGRFWTICFVFLT